MSEQICAVIDSGSTDGTRDSLPRGILLHVGCGFIIPDGWVNVDASWNLRAARVPGLRRVLKRLGWISEEAAAHAWSRKVRFCDVSRGLPFADG